MSSVAWISQNMGKWPIQNLIVMLPISPSTSLSSNPWISASMDIHLRRRAILTGLRPFLQDDELQAALVLWQQDYASQPVFALSGLVAQCCTRPELKPQRGSMLRALIAALALPSDQLLPDLAVSSQGMTQQSKAQSKAQATGPDEMTRAFMQLIYALLAVSDPALQALIRQRLQASLESLGLPRLHKQAMWAWLSGQGGAAGQAGSLGQAYGLKPLQALINQAYVVMCEQLGPVKADHHLASAVNITQAKLQGSSFSVYDLL